MRSLGADTFIDRAAEDFAANGRTYDVIVDCVGDAGFERVERSLEPGGALLMVATGLRGLVMASRDSRRSGRLVTATGARVSHDEMAELSQLADSGALRPVIDRSYDLDDIVEAHQYVDTGQKNGSVVLRIS